MVFAVIEIETILKMMSLISDGILALFNDSILSSKILVRSDALFLI